ncbi:mandelate racemase/muconate lactonizing enzyme family protein [Halococcus sp. AFM35]|uniref:mandelate racemase/muconate lactonizing enzyme family protein n=1 Tax=Halococcus sp. AFM35 TaxID=3421653 RepID=UPI003EB89CA6
MEITGVTQYHLAHDLDGSFDPTWVPGYPQGSHECELFEIETDAGITGITASPSIPAGITYDDTLRLLLLGEDPHDVAHIRRKLASLDLLSARPWHIEVGLWDIIGKDAGKPIHELLGTTSHEIPAYASTGEVQPADERIAYIEDRLDEGFEAVKLRITSKEDVDIVRQVRKAFPDLTLMVDANKGWAIRAIEEEEQWSFAEALAVARATSKDSTSRGSKSRCRATTTGGTPACATAPTFPSPAGSSTTDHTRSVVELLHHDAVDVLQPDAMLATGIQEGAAIAASARDQGVKFVPHTWTNGVGFAANLHVMTAARSGWCEFPMEPPLTPDARDFLLTETLDHDEGTVTAPDGPGLGIELDRSVVDEAE